MPVADESERVITLAAQIRAFDPERVLARVLHHPDRRRTGGPRPANPPAGDRILTRLTAGFTPVVDESGDTNEDGETS